MSNYTPTTEEVLRCYRLQLTSDQGQREDESFAEFLSRLSIETAQQQVADREAAQRWLAEVERAAAQKAWDEGERAGCEDALGEQRGIGPAESARNPYRRNEGENVA